MNTQPAPYQQITEKQFDNLERIRTRLSILERTIEAFCRLIDDDISDLHRAHVDMIRNEVLGVHELLTNFRAYLTYDEDGEGNQL